MAMEPSLEVEHCAEEGGEGGVPAGEECIEARRDKPKQRDRAVEHIARVEESVCLAVAGWWVRPPQACRDRAESDYSCRRKRDEQKPQRGLLVIVVPGCCRDGRGGLEGDASAGGPVGQLVFAWPFPTPGTRARRHPPDRKQCEDDHRRCDDLEGGVAELKVPDEPGESGEGEARISTLGRGEDLRNEEERKCDRPEQIAQPALRPRWLGRCRSL